MVTEQTNTSPSDNTFPLKREVRNSNRVQQQVPDQDRQNEFVWLMKKRKEAQGMYVVNQLPLAEA